MLNSRRILQLADEFDAGTRRASPAEAEFARRVFAWADKIDRVRATVREIARLAGATLRR